jgi:hypothetical protein
MAGKAAVILTIKDIPDMTPKGRREILKWLKQQVQFFEKDYDKLGKTFVSRFFYK